MLFRSGRWCCSARCDSTAVRRSLGASGLGVSLRQRRDAGAAGIGMSFNFTGAAADFAAVAAAAGSSIGIAVPGRLAGACTSPPPVRSVAVDVAAGCGLGEEPADPVRVSALAWATASGSGFSTSGVMVAPGRARCSPFTITCSLGFNPSVTTLMCANAKSELHGAIFDHLLIVHNQQKITSLVGTDRAFFHQQSGRGLPMAAQTEQTVPE